MDSLEQPAKEKQPPAEVQQALLLVVMYCIQQGMSAYKLKFFPSPITDPDRGDAAGFMIVSLGTLEETNAMEAVVSAELHRQRIHARPSEAQAFMARFVEPDPNSKKVN